nr:probable G-protein coupled receptor CG31760 isoform X1 [Procambarus clarkii]XP_045608319.1 probable G-protein coupled receptor CG31760 isoform X1 [Procambarus clarkii]XP_045608320.1 probable G-protein coupled receptor CG31760 isoform X1 [Procambarus clarkii]XP_045608321.1 probable G-protein coupled receptor CG31760 isoform X1 [Procambarus clarkii]
MLVSGRGIVWAVGVIVLVGGVTQRVEARAALSQEMDSVERKQMLRNVSQKEQMLNIVSQITTGSLGTTCVSDPFHRFVLASLEVKRYDSARQKADLLVRVLRNLEVRSEELLKAMVLNLLASDEVITAARVVLRNDTQPFVVSTHRPPSHYPPTEPNPPVNASGTKLSAVTNQPWYDDSGNTSKFQNHSIVGKLGWWTYPYFHCRSKRWLLSYTVPITSSSMASSDRPAGISDVGLVSLDVDVTSLDINQCDPETSSSQQQTSQRDTQFVFFLGTHKCHRNSSECVFTPGHGWVRGGYRCQCRPGFYPRNKTFNGTHVEVAWEGKVERNNPTYEMLYVCRPCKKECPECHSNKPCMAHYNWPFRIALLVISSLCIVLSFVMMGLVYHYRSVKVFRLASPTFLCICLIGCTIMYLEMAAIFPVLDTYSCIATKWTRHLGFCITFSSLLMKTWRVSLTYRVTSAHKIKLTDKQLLQWLTPILMIVLVYLGAWTLSATPSAVDLKDYSHLKFKQCRYDWWDHSLAMGEVLFLMWGVKVCFSVRKAESFFDEAKYISWAVYNIAIVNIVMVTFHLIIFPDAGPDIKYLFGFLRTQFSTSTTVLLIFGPKFYRIVQGTGDQYDNRARAKGVTASFSLNGLGVMNEEPADLSQENEELKEEIQKLAAQMEFMKIVHMEMNNRHLKPKPGGYFSDKNSVINTAQSPGAKTNPPPLQASRASEGSNENSSARLSPAAELASERV